MVGFKKFINSWLAVLLWCALIFIISSLPTLPKLKSTVVDRLLKDAAHFLEYAVLFFLTWRAMKFRKSKSLLAFVFSAFYALSDELHQLFVPGRKATIMDLTIDIMGAALMWLILKKKGENK